MSVTVKIFTRAGGRQTLYASRTLDVSPITIKRDWAFARAWLCERIGVSGTSPT